MTRSPLGRFVLAAALALLLPVSAFASAASDAHKAAKAKAKTAAAMSEGPAREAAEEQLQSWAKKKAASLMATDLSKMDTAYVGLMLGQAGLKQEAVDTLRKAVLHTGKTKYGANVHAYLVQALIDSEQVGSAAVEFRTMAKQHPDTKPTKKMAMNVGMALRAQKKYVESAEALNIALEQRNPKALKPMVNSWLMAGKPDKAAAAINRAIELAGDAGKKDEHQVMLATVEKMGKPIAVEFDSFSGEKPDWAGKVLVIGVWNVSARTLKWTMGLLESIRTGYPDDVVALAGTTYYQKDPETGKIDESMSPERERELGEGYRSGFQGVLAYAKDRAALQDLGVSGLPHFIVVSRDGKLLFSHTLNSADSTDVEILKDVLAGAIGK